MENSMTIRCKKLAKLLNVNHREFASAVKAALVTGRKTKYNDCTLWVLGAYDENKAFHGCVHVTEPDGSNFVLSDARRYTDSFGSIILLEGRQVA